VKKFFFLVLLCVSAETRAQQSFPTDSTNAVVGVDTVSQPAGCAVEEVVVSGTLRAVRRDDSPIPVEVYTKDFFKKNPTPNLFEGLAVANGLQPQIACNVCNAGDIHINGMEGPYTMVLIDGMPIVSALSTVYGLMGIPSSLIQRVEVVKGPASTLYGSDAVAGLINVITKSPITAPAFSGEVWGTTQSEWNADLGAKVKLGAASGLLGVNGFLYRTVHDGNGDGFMDMAQQQRLSIFNKWSVARRYPLPASFAVRLFGEDRWGGQNSFSPAMRGSDAVYGEWIATRRGEVFGQYGLRLFGQEMLLEGSYNYHQQDSWYGATPFNARQHTAFAQLRWTKELGAHVLTAGLPFRYLYYDDNTAATAAAEDGGSNRPGVTLLPGVFVQDEWKVSNRVTTLAGLRYEHHNVQGSIASPRVAVKWSPARAQTVRLSVGNGFRVVNLATEDHMALSGARRLIIAETLQPERSWNGTLNYTTTLTPGFGPVTVDASLFHTRFSNKIVADYDTDPQAIIYRNLAGHGVSQGASLSLDAGFKNGLKAALGATFLDVYNYIQAEDGSTERVTQIFAPRWQATWLVSYPIRSAGLSLDLTGKVTGPQRLPVVPGDFRPEWSPVFALAHAQATKKFKGGTEVFLAVRNLLNFIPRDPILHADDPFDRPGGRYWNADGTPRADTNPAGYTFDPSYNYAPLQGRKLLLGVRWALL